jgi:hypothetical protein
MFSFWNDFLHEKFSEEGDGVLLALGSLQNSITGTYGLQNLNPMSKHSTQTT